MSTTSRHGEQAAPTHSAVRVRPRLPRRPAPSTPLLPRLYSPPTGAGPADQVRACVRGLEGGLGVLLDQGGGAGEHSLRMPSHVSPRLSAPQPQCPVRRDGMTLFASTSSATGPACLPLPCADCSHVDYRRAPRGGRQSRHGRRANSRQGDRQFGLGERISSSGRSDVQAGWVGGLFTLDKGLCVACSRGRQAEVLAAEVSKLRRMALVIDEGHEWHACDW